MRLQLPYNAVLAEEPLQERTKYDLCPILAPSKTHESRGTRSLYAGLNAKKATEQERLARRLAGGAGHATRPRLDTCAQKLEMWLVLTSIGNGECAICVRSNFVVLGVLKRSLAMQYGHIGTTG